MNSFLLDISCVKRLVLTQLSSFNYLLRAVYTLSWKLSFSISYELRHICIHVRHRRRFYFFLSLCVFLHTYIYVHVLNCPCIYTSQFRFEFDHTFGYTDLINWILQLSSLSSSSSSSSSSPSSPSSPSSLCRHFLFGFDIDFSRCCFFSSLFYLDFFFFLTLSRTWSLD